MKSLFLSNRIQVVMTKIMESIYDLKVEYLDFLRLLLVMIEQLIVDIRILSMNHVVRHQIPVDLVVDFVLVRLVDVDK